MPQQAAASTRSGTGCHDRPRPNMRRLRIGTRIAGVSIGMLVAATLITTVPSAGAWTAADRSMALTQPAPRITSMLSVELDPPTHQRVTVGPLSPRLGTSIDP